VTLGTAVILPALRQPVLLAHQLATLDALSGGRLVVGVGSGFPYPPTEAQFRAVEKDFDRRVPAMEEAIEAMRALWRSADAPVSYEGESISFSDVLIRPRPAREGGPPIWMAGAGRIAEARAGRLGDGWLPYPPEARLYRDGLERVRNAARHSNRAEPTGALYATITLQRGARSAGEALRESVERYYDAPLAALARIQALRAGAADEIAGWLREYVLLGARHLVLRFADPDPLTALEQAGRELLPLLRDIEKEIR